MLSPTTINAVELFERIDAEISKVGKVRKCHLVSLLDGARNSPEKMSSCDLKKILDSTSRIMSVLENQKTSAMHFKAKKLHQICGEMASRWYFKGIDIKYRYVKNVLINIIESKCNDARDIVYKAAFSLPGELNKNAWDIINNGDYKVFNRHSDMTKKMFRLNEPEIPAPLPPDYEEVEHCYVNVNDQDINPPTYEEVLNPHLNNALPRYENKHFATWLSLESHVYKYRQSAEELAVVTQLLARDDLCLPVTVDAGYSPIYTPGQLLLIEMTDSASSGSQRA